MAALNADRASEALTALTDQLTALRDLGPAEREAALTELTAGDGGPPAAALPLMQALVELPAEQTTALTEAAASIATAAAAGGEGPPSLPADAVTTVMATLQGLPAGAKRAAIMAVPEEARPVAVAMQFIPPTQAGELASRAGEFAAAVETVVGKDLSSGGSGDGGGAGADAGGAEGGAAATPVADAAAERQARVAAAVTLHRVFTELPPRARKELAAVLPPEAQPVAQMAEGLAEEDIGKILDTLDERTGRATPRMTPTPKTSPSGELDASLPPGADGPASTGASADDVALVVEDDAAAARRQAREAAKIVAKAETRRVCNWVRRDPCSLRVLNFLGGCFLFFSGFTGIFIQVFNAFRIWMIILESYIMLFGVFFSSLEVDSELCTKHVASRVQQYAGFLTTATGRGLFLIFVGLLSLAIWDPETDGWTEMFNIGAGFYVMILSILNLVAGCKSQAKMTAAARSIDTEEALRAAFEEHDLSMRGKLETEDLMALFKSLDPPVIMSSNEIRATVLAMDDDHDGAVSCDELVQWWRAVNSGRNPAMAAAKRAMGYEDYRRTNSQWYAVSGGASSLRVISLFVGVFYAMAGFIGIWVEMLAVSGASASDAAGIAEAAADKNTWILRMLINVYIVMFGVMVALLEARARVCGINVTASVTGRAKFLRFVWGRGLLFMFLGTIALSQWREEELANILAGFAMYFCGVANVIVGGLTSKKVFGGLNGVGPDRAGAAFRSFDSDGDGFIDAAELRDLMSSLGVSLSRQQAEGLMNELDVNGDGVCGLREFVHWSQGKLGEADALDSESEASSVRGRGSFGGGGGGYGAAAGAGTPAMNPAYGVGTGSSDGYTPQSDA